MYKYLYCIQNVWFMIKFGTFIFLIAMETIFIRNLFDIIKIFHILHTLQLIICLQKVTKLV